MVSMSGLSELGNLVTLANMRSSPSDQLLQLARQYHERIAELENEKYDLEYAVSRKDYEITEMAAKVNDMRGKL